MARKEIVVDHSEISDAQTITNVVKRKFAEHGLSIHRHEADHVDDNTTGKRIYKVKNVKFFGPWSHRG